MCLKKQTIPLKKSPLAPLLPLPPGETRGFEVGAKTEFPPEAGWDWEIWNFKMHFLVEP